jgi:hypothetical protein
MSEPTAIPANLLPDVVDILATRDEDEAIRQLQLHLHDRWLVERAIAWIPEAFGAVLVAQYPGMRQPGTFSAFDTAGRTREFAMAAEPIFEQARDYARMIHRDGPRELFVTLAARSSIAQVVGQLLDADGSAADIVLTGTALGRIPAEIYGATTRTWWSRVKSWLAPS